MSFISSTYSVNSQHSQQFIEPILHPIRQCLDGMEVRNRQFAKLVCKLIPSQCPFARDIKLFGQTIIHIPPLCKINPLYDQLMGLRFRALSFLADQCGEDITIYCG